jgi:hypothetical protein
MTTADMSMPVRSLKVFKKDISYIRWCLESHDGIAVSTTRTDEPDVVDLTIAPGFLDDAEALIAALVEELGARRVASPPHSPLR